MALSQDSFVGDGVTTDFTINFPFIVRAHIKVELVGVPTSAFTFLSDTLIRFDTAPANGVAILIKRVSSLTARLTDYVAPGNLSEEDLDNDSLQAFFLAQEANDIVTSALIEDAADGKFDAKSKVIKSVANGVDTNDAINKSQLDAVTAAAGNVPTPGNPTDDDKLLQASGGTFSWGPKVTPFMETVLDDTTAAVARATMGPYGDALVTPTGAITARSLAARFSEVVNVKDHGAVGDGVADDATAIQAALDVASPKVVVFPATSGGYKILSALTIPANTCVLGYGATVTKGANGDVFALGNASEIYGLTIQGDGANFTGRGITIDTNGDQIISDCKILDMASFCIEVLNLDKAIRLSVVGGGMSRNAVGTPCIKLAGVATPETVGGRQFIGIDFNGHWGFDIGASQNTDIHACHFINMSFRTGSRKCILSGNRVAVLGGTLTIDGQDHSITGNIIAGDIALAAGVQQTRVQGNVLTSTNTITDSSGNGTNYTDWQEVDFTPIWEADSTNPAIGNGTISGRFVRTGKSVTLYVDLAFGSTTTFGTGAWKILLPAALNFNVKRNATGIIKALDSSTALRVGAVTTASGTPMLRMQGSGDATQWQNTVPHAWATSDSIQLQITYEIN